MKPIQRMLYAIQRAAYADEPPEQRREEYRRSVTEITAGLERDQLEELVFLLGGMLESRYR